MLNVPLHRWHSHGTRQSLWHAVMACDRPTRLPVVQPCFLGQPLPSFIQQQLPCRPHKHPPPSFPTPNGTSALFSTLGCHRCISFNFAHASGLGCLPRLTYLCLLPPHAMHAVQPTSPAATWRLHQAATRTGKRLAATTGSCQTFSMERVGRAVAQQAAAASRATAAGVRLTTIFSRCAAQTGQSR